eukprot:5760150-Amphidinium_carterae.1
MERQRVRPARPMPKLEATSAGNARERREKRKGKATAGDEKTAVATAIFVKLQIKTAMGSSQWGRFALPPSFLKAVNQSNHVTFHGSSKASEMTSRTRHVPCLRSNEAYPVVQQS